ncbi:hypothetical protein FN846DRAFT_34912 [Sphaerosporella brunnea]|uniref:Uncharacterized protein n=1 Tax=Sphaerosporella brunnea TaxID=1250544 RepID=A0A5J5EVA5_9PEZI|nr:hypothetical protein FN846DRAFT_34912 [Sphaerosporella brunnea]
MAESHLLSVLSTHSSSLSSDDISWAFTTPKTAAPVTDWVETYLKPSTLLSLEEHNIHTHLQKTGGLKRVPPSHFEPPDSEAHLRSRIDEINASSALLEQQTEQLRAQAATLAAQRSRRRAERERKKKLEAARKRKWHAERDEAVAARDDLLGIMREEVKDLHETVASAEQDIEEVERALESDDRVLSRLERLAGELVVAPASSVAENEHKNVEALVARLASLETKAVRKRLERVFLSYSRPGPNVTAEQEELQKEIDGLYKEIPAVARGTAYNEFLSPLLAAARKRGSANGENWALGGEYIVDVLSHLRKRLEAVQSLLTSCYDRDGAVMTLIATFDREAGSPPAEEKEKGRPVTPPSHHPQGQKRLGSPVRFADAPATKLGRIPFLTPLRRRGKAVDFSKSHFPELALLSHLGISLPSASSPSAAPVITTAFLGRQISAAAARIDAIGDLSFDNWEEARSEAARVARVLRESLWSGNEFELAQRGEGIMVVLRDEVRGGAMEVERGVREVGGVMGGLVGRVDEVEREHGDVVGGGKRAFVARWGR